jgi:hypothetical protein
MKRSTPSSPLPSSPISGERLFLFGTTALFAVMVFWAFARRFYLAALFRSPALPWPLQLHGLVMTGWVALLFVQVAIAASGRLQWHRRLGVAGVVWAVFVVLAGSLATLHASAREVRGHTRFAQMQVAITGLELTQMLLFAALVGAAVWFRRRGDYHKRLMLLTVVCMLPSVLARLPITPDNSAIMIGLDTFVVGCIAIDTLRTRRLHPAFGWGGVLVLAALHAAYYMAFTPAWIGFASRVVS